MVKSDGQHQLLSWQTSRSFSFAWLSRSKLTSTGPSRVFMFTFCGVRNKKSRAIRSPEFNAVFPGKSVFKVVKHVHRDSGQADCGGKKWKQPKTSDGSRGKGREWIAHKAHCRRLYDKECSGVFPGWQVSWEAGWWFLPTELVARRFLVTWSVFWNKSKKYF